MGIEAKMQVVVRREMAPRRTEAYRGWPDEQKRRTA